MSSKKSITLNIKGTDWKFVSLTAKQFEKENPPDNDDYIDHACADNEKHTVFFKKEMISAHTIRHELQHVLVFESLIESSDLNAHQMEDLCCEIVGKHNREIEAWTIQILEAFARG